VLVLNVKDVIKKRISIDPNSTFDGIHFPNPGEFTVTSFVSHCLFHMLAIKVLAPPPCSFDHGRERRVVFKEGTLEIKAFTVIKQPPRAAAYYLVLDDGQKHLIWDWDSFTAS